MNDSSCFGAVLIVSGDTALATSLEKMINDCHFHVSVAASVGEAITACTDIWFHLVLIDADAMKDAVDELISNIRIVAPDMPVALLGSDDSLSRPDVRYLDKPLTLDLLKTTLLQAVSTRIDRNERKIGRGTVLGIGLSLLLWAVMIWLWRWL